MLEIKYYQKILLLIIPFLFTGCIYPAYKTIQPKASTMVVDESLKPIEKAKVYLFSNMMHGSLERNNTMLTDNSGIANFEKQKEWYLESLMIHGSHTFYWNWCVEKEGFESQYTNGYFNFKKNQKFILKKGVSTQCILPTQKVSDMPYFPVNPKK